MKIAILYSHLKELGGAERVILKQANLLQKQGHLAECYFAYVDTNLTKESGILHHHAKSFFPWLIPNNPTARIVLSLPLAPLTISALKDKDILICHGYGPASWVGYLNKKIKNTRYISYIHSPPRFLYLSPKDKKLWRFNDVRKTIFKLSKITWPLLKEIDHVGVVNSDAILTNSHFTASRIRSIYGAEAQVCYPPVDTESFRILTEDAVGELRKDFGWPLILSTGRVVAVKRWEWLIEIMSHVTRDFHSATLAITGEISKENNRYIERLLKLARKYRIDKNIRFLGYQSQKELVKLYNIADTYVYSVPREDFGLGPVEAMACGTPSVVWNDGGGPCETVIEGRTGFKARPYDVEDFAEKTMKTVEIDRTEIATKTRSFVEENFTCERHLKTLEEAIRKLR